VRSARGSFTKMRSPPGSIWNDSGCAASGMSAIRAPLAGSIAASAPAP
jgi:hypothetical protein